jgi:hypothetical protein
VDLCNCYDHSSNMIYVTHLHLYGFISYALSQTKQSIKLKFVLMDIEKYSLLRFSIAKYASANLLRISLHLTRGAIFSLNCHSWRRSSLSCAGILNVRAKKNEQDALIMPLTLSPQVLALLLFHHGRTTLIEC